ncbi:hypothetical protein TNCV_3947451 [Trichonephila clavipes]|nr:hypothetical protein TNCV_3947451 [Trichonephila clavipes]
MPTSTFNFQNLFSSSEHATPVSKHTMRHDLFTSSMIDTLIPLEHYFQISSRTAIGDPVINIRLSVIVICARIFSGTPDYYCSLFFDALRTRQPSYANAPLTVEPGMDAVSHGVFF